MEAAHAAPAPRPPLARLVAAPLEPSTWLSLVYLVTSLAVGTAWFCVLVTAIAVGVSTAIIWVGLPVLAATVLVWRWGAGVERRWVEIALGVSIAAPYRPLPDGSRRKRWGVILRDPATWKDLLYLFLLFPLGIAYFVVTVTLWAWALGLVLMPAYYWLLPDGRAELFTDGDDTLVVIDHPLEAIGCALVGLVFVILAAWATRGLGALHGAIARGLLGAGRGQLEARVTELDLARGAAVDTATEERRRIERDLHDGAQQRLVALAMGLGLAREKLDSDPDAARRLVVEAHEEAKRALVELRDLARGIHPAILTEQGLDPALSALAARSPVPVEVDVDPDLGRFSPALEGTAYFIVAEGLVNVAKHATATRALVRVSRQGDLLVIEIEDDGAGGADANGNGLRGLADRATAVEGRLTVWSPSGGPTIVRAELPCAS